MKTSTTFPSKSRRQNQRGLALVFVLIMMSIATAIALIAARITLLSDRGARNDRDRQVAFQSAELALQDARDDIMSPRTGGRGCDVGTLTLATDDGCSVDVASRGLCRPEPSLVAKPPIYKEINWEDTSSTRAYANYGEFTDRVDTLQVATRGAPAKAPKYIVVDESSQFKLWVPTLNAGAGGNVERPQKAEGALKNLRAYRVYALGYGPTEDIQVLLESVILKPALSSQCS